MRIENPPWRESAGCHGGTSTHHLLCQKTHKVLDKVHREVHRLALGTRGFRYGNTFAEHHRSRDGMRRSQLGLDGP